jgi:hypothetical protein
MIKMFFTRTLLAAALVFATFNPTPYSLVSFLVSQAESGDLLIYWPIKLILLIACGTFWTIFLRTTINSLGGLAIAVGLILILAAYALIAQAAEWGYMAGPYAMTWVILLIATLILGVGATASHVKMRWAGVRNVDDIDSHDN